MCGERGGVLLPRAPGRGGALLTGCGEAVVHRSGGGGGVMGCGVAGAVLVAVIYLSSSCPIRYITCSLH